MLRKLTTAALAIAGFMAIQLTAGQLTAGLAWAGGTAEQAQALVNKAAELVTTQGKDKAFAIIDDPKGPLVQGDLYVFAQDLNGTTLAHGVNKALIGKPLKDLKDADGKLFVREFIAVAMGKGEGWVDYKWPNPVTKKIEAKSTFVKRVGEVILGCGIYKG